MKGRSFAAVVTAAVLSCLCSPVSSAQSTRPLTVWVDTLTKGVCDGKTFTIPVWIGDLPASDSLQGFQLGIRWDVTHIDLEFPYYVAGSNTLTYLAKDRTYYPDPQGGSALIVAGNVDGSIVAGSGKPLLYLVGKIKAPDTVDGLNGWIEPFIFSTESATTFQPVTFRAGFVHVRRDTTPAFTGRAVVEQGSFGVGRLDTVSLTVQNIREKRVSDISILLKLDTSYFKAVGAIETGTLSESVTWSSKSIDIGPDSVGLRYAAPTALAAEGTLLKVILQRTTDSSFDQPLAIDRFEVNQFSCLGKLFREGARVTAERIVDTTTTGVGMTDGPTGRSIRILSVTERSMTIAADGLGIDEVTMVDGVGRVVATHSAGQAGAGRSGNSMTTIDLGGGLRSGVYFLVIRSGHDIVYKQFTFIK